MLKRHTMMQEIEFKKFALHCARQLHSLAQYVLLHRYWKLRNNLSNAAATLIEVVVVVVVMVMVVAVVVVVGVMVVVIVVVVMTVSVVAVVVSLG